jgi:hypothetical protein
MIAEMSIWDEYPSDYRQYIVEPILSAVRTGECVSVIGLSGAGKSNLLGFLAYRCSTPEQRLILIDTNRLTEFSPAAFLRLIRRSLGNSRHAEVEEEFEALDEEVAAQLDAGPLTLLLDLSLLDRTGELDGQPSHGLFNNLRALRDAHKFRLTYVTASRHALTARTEFAELVHAHTLWLGALSNSESLWNIRRFAARKHLTWPEQAVTGLMEMARSYPSLLRAACEAYSETGDLAAVAEHPAVRARVQEFWDDAPTETELRLAGLVDHPLLYHGRKAGLNTSQLTAKEHLLLSYFLGHPGGVCEKDDIIRAVWPEDKVQERGVRDDSLAQLVRRLREKIEPDPAKPTYIHTLPGRGYRFTPP